MPKIDLASLPPAHTVLPSALAQTVKANANAKYAAKDFERAIKRYKKALRWHT